MDGIATIQWLALCAVTLVCAMWLGWELVGKLSTQLGSMVRLGTGILIGLSALGIMQTSVPLLRRLPLLTLPLLVQFGVLLRLGMPNRRPSTHWGIWLHKATAWGRFRHLSPISLAVVGIAVFSVNYVAIFPRLIGAAVILLGLALHYKHRLARTAWVVIGVVVVALFGLSEIARRHEPGWWFAASNDATFFESISWSLARYGPHAHPGLPEGSIFGYHYLAYAVSGAVSEISGAPPYYVLNLLLPLVLLTSLTLVLFPYIRRRTESLAVTTGLLILLGSVLRVTSTTSFQFSSWAIAVYLMLLLELHRQEKSRRLSTRFQALLAIVAFIAVFGKATAMPIVGTLALVSSLTGRPRWFKSRPKDILKSIPWHIGPTGVFFIAYYLPNASNYSEEGERAVLRVLMVLPNNEGAWQSRGDLLWIAFLIGVAILARSTPGTHLPREVATARSLLMWVPMAGVAFAVLIPNYLQREYLSRHIGIVIILLTLIVTAHLVPLSRLSQSRSTSALFLFIFANLGFASYFAVFMAPSISGGLETFIEDPRGRWVWFVVASSEALLPAVTVFISITWHFFLARIVHESPRAIAVVFSLPLGLAFCLSAANSIDHHSSVTSSADRTTAFDASHPDSATSEVGKFFRDSTPSDAIVASNSFCCSGTEWLADASSELNDFTTIYGLEGYAEESRGGANYQHVSVSRRRFLIAGPRFMWMFPDKAGLSERLEASVLFGVTGSSEYAAKLRDDGADYFLVDKAALGDLAVPAFEERTIFENSRYLVLDLAG